MTVTDEEIAYLLGVVDLARSGQTAELEAAIAGGIPVNLTNGAGDSLLILAAYHCQADTVAMLLRRGADTGRVNDRGQTALGAAVFRQSVPVVRSLLAAGADPAAGERSALQVAQFFGLTQLTELLVTRADHRADHRADQLARTAAATVARAPTVCRESSAAVYSRRNRSLSARSPKISRCATNAPGSVRWDRAAAVSCSLIRSTTVIGSPDSSTPSA